MTSPERLMAKAQRRDAERRGADRVNAPVGNPDSEFYTTTEVAAMFRVTPATIRNWIREGKLTTIIINTRYKITRESVRKLANHDFGGTHANS